MRLALLPPDRYPCLVEAALPMSVLRDPEFHYQFGVDLFIAGVRAIARRQDAAGSDSAAGRPGPGQLG